MRKRKQQFTDRDVCANTSGRHFPPPPQTWLCLSVLSPSPPPVPSCLVLSPRIDFQFLWRSFYIIYWVGNFFVGLLSLFSAHTLLDNVIWIGQKLNSFAYMRIIYFVDSLSPPSLLQGDQLVKKKWKVKSETETGNWKTKSGKLCSLPNGQGSQSTKNTFIKSKQSLSWGPYPPTPLAPVPPLWRCVPSIWMPNEFCAKFSNFTFSIGPFS